MGAVVRIPGIEIGQELGHGAFSVVYRARQGSVDCALKIPHVRGHWTKWVYREAVALARVRHPGLPRVLEVGEVDGLPYLLMELVEGETLGDRLRRGPLATDVVLDFGCQLADTLRALHEVGLVHRDVKPRNVILDGGGRPRLVDLGFVTPAGAAPPRDQAGTRRYSAPEQFRDADRIDGRADLYALGRVLSECLIGTPPLQTQATMAVLELTSAGIPAAIARIVGGLVAESPEERYPDAVALLADLHRVRAGGAPRGAAAFESARLQPPLVGRDAELARVLAAWREVESSGGRVVFVEGIRGSGKTRFVRACTAKVRDEARGRSLEAVCRDGDPPLAALRRLFESYFASLAKLAPQERAAAMTALRTSASGPLASLAMVIDPEFSEVVEAGSAASSTVPEAFAEGAAELIIRIARQAGPLVLCFDDVQWIDTVSRDVLEAVAQRAHEAPLLLLAAARPQASAAASARVDLAGARRSTRISLGPFELRQTAALVASHLGVASVDPAVVRRVGALADDTPVGVLEVLGAFLDAGALRLRDNLWELDGATADRIALPAGAFTYLGRRLADLPPATRRVLDAAAILGTTFDEGLLARVVGLEVSDVEFALVDGRRAGLLEAEDGGHHRFSHDSLRELLASGVEDALGCRLHQKAAEALAQTEGPSAEQIFACALHFVAGKDDRTAGKACQAARKAAEVAVDRFDDEAALRFYDMAHAFADTAGLRLDAAFHNSVGEASLRVGALDESLRSFEAALVLTSDSVARAAILGKIAWVRRGRSEPDQALAALEMALATLGVHVSADGSPPVEDTPARATRAALSADARDVLYHLYHQHARLGLEAGMSPSAMLSSLHALDLAGAAAPSVALVRAHATYGNVLVFLGQKQEGKRHLATSRAMALELRDPSATAHYLQREGVYRFFVGEFDAALALFRTCTEEYGPWVEATEFCDVISNGDIIESIRGRVTEAWSWDARATDRLRQRQRTSTVFATHILYRARAALAGLGRSGQEGAWLIARLEAAGKARPEKKFYRMLCWGPQARYLLDTDRLGQPFEDLIRAFSAEGIEPSAAHPTLFEYYVAVAQARIHQCLRATPEERPARVAALRDAASELRTAAKLPLTLAHSQLADGTLAWLEGNLPKARRLLTKAEALASSETCPWVSWGVARVRAHRLRESGKLDAARDQARIAETLARAHGAEPRARWVREEFSLPAPETAGVAHSVASSSRRSSHRARRQLSSLLHLAQAPYGQLEPEQQAMAIVDDLVRELGADRVFLSFEPTGDARARMRVGRNRLGETLPAPDGWRDELMRTVRERGDGPMEADGYRAASRGGPPDRGRVVALPLYLNDEVVGSVLIERGPADPAFTPDDQEFFLLLSHQVPLGLELSRLLAERDQLHASAQQAQKMEVVGRLAGTVAHDFNNMLTIVSECLNDTLKGAALDECERDAAQDAREATDRALRLAKRLLAFSRNQLLSLGPLDTNHAVFGLRPLLDRAVPANAGYSLVFDLAEGANHAFTDEGSLEQAIMNLAINARDAMPNGGKLTVSTRNVFLGADDVRRGAPEEGDYVLIEVADTGDGMPPEVLTRVFDPFFTTKPVGRGTGLGLTSVYQFMKQCGGHLDVQSEVGRGTTFRLYFRKAEPVQVEVEKRASMLPAQTSKGAAAAMILVVDDDPAVREVTCKLLRQGGYRVLAAAGSADALKHAQTRRDEISLVILDVHMPGMSGPELGRRLADDLHLPAKMLFVTGALVPETPGGAQQLLQKPFSSDALLGRVRRILHS